MGISKQSNLVELGSNMDDYINIGQEVNVITQPFLSDLSDKDKTWDKHKSENELIKAVYLKNKQYDKLSKRLNNCADVIGFKRGVNNDTGEIKYKLHQAWFCKVRTCPTCQWRRSLKNTAKFFAKIPEIKELYPTHKFLFLTLTAKNCNPKDLRTTLADMNKGFKRLSELKAFPAVGYIKSTEITKANNGDAHPHFHILLMVKSSYFSHGYINTQTWAEMWQQSLRSHYLPIVDIRAIKPKNKLDNFSGADLQAAVVETLKYATKPQDSFFDANWLYTITEQLKGLRFLASGGVLKDILKEDLTDEEMIHTDSDAEDLALEQSKQLLLFGWKTVAKKYQKIN